MNICHRRIIICSVRLLLCYTPMNWQKLKQNDNAPCPPGWQLSLPAARAFILGDSAQNISRKVVISPSAVERMLVTLATGRGLMLVGGTPAPQNLSCLNYWQPLLAAMPG